MNPARRIARIEALDAPAAMLGRVFDLRDGALLHAPAAYSQPAWDTRVNEGRIEVRRR